MYLGIEIGGTKLQLGVGPGDGCMAGVWRGTVDVAAGAEGIRQQIIAAVPELLARSGVERGQIAGVGIGFGGPVDDATRTVIKSHQIEGWDNFPLADWITDLLGWPAVLGNDADVAGLAEALFGAGKGLSPIFYITIGSGIGGGLIIDGEIYRGCGRGAAEIGHTCTSWIPAGDPTWIEEHFRSATGWTHEEFLNEWNKNHQGELLEEHASGWAITNRAKIVSDTEFAEADTEALLRTVDGQVNRLTAGHVAQAAGQGDALALEILDYAWAHLAEAIRQVIVLLCPRRIVIGGGVSLMGEKLLFEPLRRMVAERVFKPFAGCYDIVPAALGEEVVVHGALALARRHLGRRSHET